MKAVVKTQLYFYSTDGNLEIKPQNIQLLFFGLFHRIILKHQVF